VRWVDQAYIAKGKGTHGPSHNLHEDLIKHQEHSMQMKLWWQLCLLNYQKFVCARSELSGKAGECRMWQNSDCDEQHECTWAVCSTRIHLSKEEHEMRISRQCFSRSRGICSKFWLDDTRKCFLCVNHTKPAADELVLLILDNHSTHITLDLSCH
jgi:hypothetical protein